MFIATKTAVCARYRPHHVECVLGGALVVPSHDTSAASDDAAAAVARHRPLVSVMVERQEPLVVVEVLDEGEDGCNNDA